MFSTTGGSDLSCEAYCDIYVTACKDFSEYQNEQACLDQCSQWPIGDAAATKKIYRVPVADLKPVALDAAAIPVVSKVEVRDLIPDLKANGGYVLDKVESLAIAADGTAWVATDNDGVDDSSGETMFFTIGKIGS